MHRVKVRHTRRPRRCCRSDFRNVPCPRPLEHRGAGAGAGVRRPRADKYAARQRRRRNGLSSLRRTAHRSAGSRVVVIVEDADRLPSMLRAAERLSGSGGSAIHVVIGAETAAEHAELEAQARLLTAGSSGVKFETAGPTFGVPGALTEIRGALKPEPRHRALWRFRACRRARTIASLRGDAGADPPGAVTAPDYPAQRQRCCLCVRREELRPQADDQRIVLADRFQVAAFVVDREQRRGGSFRDARGAGRWRGPRSTARSPCA